MQTQLIARPARCALAAAVVTLCAGCQGPPRREPVLAAFAMTDVRLIEKEYWGTSPSYAPPEKYEGDATGQYALEHKLRQLYREYEASSGADRRTKRDEIAYIFLTLIKHYHEGTTDDVYELTAGLASAFDIFSLAMGGLGAATGNASDKAGYSALAALGIGTRNSLAKNILAEQTAQAILQQMDAMRLTQESKIRGNLKDLSDAKYGLHAVLTDLYDYYTAGSVKDAVSELAKSAQKAKEDALRARDTATTKEEKP